MSGMYKTNTNAFGESTLHIQSSLSGPQPLDAAEKNYAIWVIGSD